MTYATPEPILQTEMHSETAFVLFDLREGPVDKTEMLDGPAVVGVLKGSVVVRNAGGVALLLV